MRTGHVLHWIARVTCGPELTESVVEPLLADLQHEIQEAPTAFARSVARVRAILAFWKTLLLCCAQDAAVWPLKLPPDRAFFWCAGVALALVGGAGPHWVRTGEFSLVVALAKISRVVVIYPWAIQATPPWSPIVSGSQFQRRTARRLILLAVLTAIACVLNPADRGQIAGATALGLLAAWRFRTALSRTDPWQDHTSITA